MKHVAQLVNAFVHVDTIIDDVECANGTIEYMQLQELSAISKELLPVIDTMPLPMSAKQAARNVGDFFYLVQDLADKALAKAGEMTVPTVREVRKYSDDPYGSDIILDAEAMEKVYLYREKARETLRKTANTYGQSCEKPFSSQ